LHRFKLNCGDATLAIGSRKAGAEARIIARILQLVSAVDLLYSTDSSAAVRSALSGKEESREADELHPTRQEPAQFCR